MKNNFKLSFSTIALCSLITLAILSAPAKALASENDSTSTSVASTKINAQILPTVWYSNLSIEDGSTTRIFAGIQNDSGVDFSGIANFFVDGNEINTKKFSSPDGELMAVYTDWVAIPGSHEVYVKVSTTSLPADKILLSYESEKSKISVSRKITPEVIKQAILDNANVIVSSIDNVTSNLAGKIESLKIVDDSKSVNNADASTTSKKGPGATKGSVLGTSTGPSLSSGSGSILNSIKGPADFIFNILMSILSFVVKRWVWTIVGIIIIFLFLRFRRGR